MSTGYGIMGDENLLDVVQTIFGLPPETAGTDIAAEASVISKLVPTSTLQDPTKLQQLTERFTAMYDSTYGPGSTRRRRSPLSSDGVLGDARFGGDDDSERHHQFEQQRQRPLLRRRGVQQRDDGEPARFHSGRVGGLGSRCEPALPRGAASLGQASRAYLPGGYAPRNGPPRRDATP